MITKFQVFMHEGSVSYQLHIVKSGVSKFHFLSEKPNRWIIGIVACARLNIQGKRDPILEATGAIPDDSMKETDVASFI